MRDASIELVALDEVTPDAVIPGTPTWVAMETGRGQGDSLAISVSLSDIDWAQLRLAVLPAAFAQEYERDDVDADLLAERRRETKLARRAWTDAAQQQIARGEGMIRLNPLVPVSGVKGVWDEGIRQVRLLEGNYVAKSLLAPPYVGLQEGQKLLHALSFELWTERARGHGLDPRRIWDGPTEILWLFASTWYWAGRELSSDEVRFTVEHEAERRRARIEGMKLRAAGAVRSSIPPDVISFVWQRDGGRCTRCGGQRNLEIDHIIPFSKGGSSTARNLQLLCEQCNREKSDEI